MIYKSIETCPYKVVMKMVNDPISNLHLLSTEENPDLEILATVWLGIYEELQNLDPNNEANKILNLEKEISSLKCKHDWVQLAVTALEFDYDEELVQMLRDFGYKLRNESYYTDLEKIRRESKGILTKINHYKKQLPQQEENEEDFTKVNIDELLAFYTTVLGIDFDYNTVSFTKVLAIEKQVSQKIKAIENQNQKK